MVIVFKAFIAAGLSFLVVILSLVEEGFIPFLRWYKRASIADLLAWIGGLIFFILSSIVFFYAIM